MRFHRVLQGSTEFYKDSTKFFTRFYKVPQGQMFCKVPWLALEGSSVPCARRLKSHRSSKLRAQKIALLMGGTLSKTEINVLALWEVRSRCCGTHCAEHMLGISLGLQGFHELWGKVPKTNTRFPPGCAKAMGQP